MSIKFSVVSAMCALVLAVTAAACKSSEPVDGGNKPATLYEIRSERDNISKIGAKYENLNLSNAELYIPDVNEITNFEFTPIELSADEREVLLLEAAEVFSGEKADKSRLSYLGFKGETYTFDEVKNNPERSDNYFVKYITDNYDLGINIGGNYLYGRKTEISEIAQWEDSDYWIEFGTPAESYRLSAEIPDVEIPLADGTQSLADTLVTMTDTLRNKMPYFRSDKLMLVPEKAQTYKVGDNLGVKVSYRYEYDGVAIDSYFRGSYYNADNGKPDDKTGIHCEASAVWTNSIDELYSAYNYGIQPLSEVNSEFVSLDSFLASLSNKLTGNSEFKIEYIGLVYGLERVFPDDFYANPEAKMWEYEPIKIIAKPHWIAYIPNTGIAETPCIRAVADGITGEIEILK